MEILLTHNVLLKAAVPLSLVELLIKIPPEDLDIQNQYGSIPLHFAADLSSINCFRAVLRRSNIEATMTQNVNGQTPFSTTARHRMSVWVQCGSCFASTVIQP
jgi:ankyrin repeat protein